MTTHKSCLEVPVPVLQHSSLDLSEVSSATVELLPVAMIPHPVHTCHHAVPHALWCIMDHDGTVSQIIPYAHISALPIAKTGTRSAVRREAKNSSGPTKLRRRRRRRHPHTRSSRDPAAFRAKLTTRILAIVTRDPLATGSRSSGRQRWGHGARDARQNSGAIH